MDSANERSCTSDGTSVAPLRLHCIYSAMANYQCAPSNKCSYRMQVRAADPLPGGYDRTHARTIHSRLHVHTNGRYEREKIRERESCDLVRWVGVAGGDMEVSKGGARGL